MTSTDRVIGKPCNLLGPGFLETNNTTEEEEVSDPTSSKTEKMKGHVNERDYECYLIHFLFGRQPYCLYIMYLCRVAFIGPIEWIAKYIRDNRTVLNYAQKNTNASTLFSYCHDVIYQQYVESLYKNYM